MPLAIAVITEDDEVADDLHIALPAGNFHVRRYTGAWHLEDDPESGVADVLILDYQTVLGDIHGCVLRCLAGMVDIPLVILANAPETRSVVAAMQAGASTVLEKPVAPDALRDAISDAAGVEKQPLAWPVCLEQLTRQQRRVVQLVYAGRSNRDIGETLGISVKTVEMHRNRIMGTLGQSSVAGLIRLIDRETGGSPGWSSLGGGAPQTVLRLRR